MRVLHVIDKLSMDGINPSSCTVLFGGWAAPMTQQSCESEVLSLAEDHSIAPYLEERGVPTFFAGQGKLSLGNISEIRRRIADGGFDLVHLHGYGAAHFGRLASRQAGVPNVVHEHAVLQVKPHHYLVDRLLRNKTDAAVAVSDYVRQFMIEGRSIPEERIRTIGNGVDLSRFQRSSAAEQTELKRSLGIGDAKLIGTVTRFREEKGNKYLIESLAKLREARTDVELLLVGDGEDRSALESLAQSLGVFEKIHWLGFRDDVERVMSLFDIHVVPSLTEGYPLALAEGMAVGNAMVVTEVGGMREIGSNRDNVLFVPSQSGDAIAAACNELLNDQELAASIAASGERTAKDMGIDTSAARLVSLYRELLSG